MTQDSLNNKKIALLQEKIKQAYVDGTFESKKSVLHMEAVGLDLSDADFEELVANGSKYAQDNEKVKKFANKNKVWITLLIIVLIALEWVLNIHTEEVVSLETHEVMNHTSLRIGFIWMLLINFITALVAVIALSIIYRKKNK